MQKKENNFSLDKCHIKIKKYQTANICNNLLSVSKVFKCAGNGVKSQETPMKHAAVSFRLHLKKTTKDSLINNCS